MLRRAKASAKVDAIPAVFGATKPLEGQDCLCEDCVPTRFGDCGMTGGEMEMLLQVKMSGAKYVFHSDAQRWYTKYSACSIV